MSATAADIAGLDLSRARRVPMTRLVRVELRKMADTRAGLWLLIGIAALAAVVMAIFMVTADQADRTFVKLVGAAVIPQMALLPVLGILLITSEWTQRTALVTFTLEPVRLRVLAAKGVAALAFGLAALVVTVAMGAAVTTIGGNEVAWDGVGVATIGKLALVQESMILQGLAFGLVILNSAGAIATFFVLPTAVSLITMMWKAVEDIARWIDFDSGVLLQGTTLTNEQWAQFGVTSLVWIVLPLIAGLFRVLRKEVK
jgi:ABC-2 type transport system permease protein